MPITKENQVLLFKQFRPGPEKVLLELPGGAIEKNERPEQAAMRELLEETGYEGDFQCVGTSLQSAYSTLLRYNFVAQNCVKIDSQKLDKNEFGKIIEMDLNAFRKHLRSGQLTDIATGYLGLDFLDLL